jgi:tripartite-type tricarboxylate transporter receptor subunit TctC
MKFPHRRQFLHLASGAAALPALARIARAQSYPTRAVRVIVPYAAAGPTDVFARFIAQKLSDRLGKQFYVENIPGASGNIGTGQAARATPDGNTLLCAYSSYVVNPSLFAKIPYDPERDFDPVTLAVTSTTVLVVNPSVPAKTVNELVTLIRGNPGKYSYAHGGVATATHLAGEQFRTKLGLDLVPVPYNGAGPATAAVVAGHTLIGFSSITPAVPQIKEGNLRALAVTSKRRSQPISNVPTMAEAGYEGMESDSWVGLLVPAGTPKDIIALLNREVLAVLSQPDMKDRLTTLGLDPAGSSPEQFAGQIKYEIEMWAKLIRAANIKTE